MILMARNARQLTITMTDKRPLSEIAADFEDLKYITKTDDNKPGVKELYEGYSQLVGVSRNAADGTIRVTLEKEA